MILGVNTALLFPQISFAQVLTMGSARANESGAFSYEIPIKVPPGTSGMEPKLSIAYNSQGGNGLLGVGWGMSGLSAIGRCPQTLAQDNVRGAVNYDNNDRYCIDGQRLLAVSGTYGASGTEYRTELESYGKIVSYGTTSNGPLWFKVQTKAGLVMEYGNTADSRIEAQGKDTVSTWALNKVSDIKGNYFTVSYTKDAVNGSFYPDRMDYTGNAAAGLSPDRSVRFTYETRPDAPTLYHAGSLIKNAVRMTHIKTYVGETAVKDYTVNYGSGSTTGRSIVTGIAECDGAATCLPALSMAYQQGGDNFTQWSHDDVVSEGIRTADGSSIYFADINGDGRTDLIRVTSIPGAGTTTRIALGKADGDFDYWTHTSTVPGGPGEYAHYFADVNGDGRADWIQVKKNEDEGKIGLGQADGSFEFWTNSSASRGAADNYEHYFVDVNGDGMADWIQISRTSDVGWVGLATGGGNFQHWTASFTMGAVNSYQHYFADINGDGKADWIQVARGSNNGNVGLSNGDGTFQRWTWSSSSICAANACQHYLIDLNGDGKADWIQIDGASNAGSVAFSRGDGTFATWDWSSSSIGAASSYQAYFADINGDGYPDWIQIQRNADAGSVGLNDGKGNFTFWSSSGSAGATNNYAHYFADVNGDGKADWIQSGTAAGTAGYIGLAAGQIPDLLATITTGVGATTSVTYKPLTDPSVYTKDSGGDAATPPVVDIQGPMYVVSSVASNNGVGGTFVTNYIYGGLKADTTGRGLLGFRWNTQTDAASGIQIKNTYRQDFPYTGLLAQIKKTQSGGAVLSQVDNTYTCFDFNGGCAVAIGRRYFPYVSQSVESGNDLNGAALPTVTTTNQFDIYGNATQIVVGTGDGYSKTTVNSYINDDANWFLGRLTRSQVTATKP